MHAGVGLNGLKHAVLLSIDDGMDEIRALLRTLGVVIDREIIQRREEPHRTTFLGPGKVNQVKDELLGMNIDYIVINGSLKPSQHHALEMLFQKVCLDRIGVILRIFAEHAHTEEAKNQVMLATLRYELPFLREWIHKAKSGERPGFLSGGAYATEVYYEHARSHIKRIEENLKGRSVQREIRRSMRRKRGYFLVSIAGYTNAGKSALLNALSGSQELVDDMLFSTLSTTTRKLEGSRRRILLTDTVGFISNLPPTLIEAFNSTLEEILLADLILIVVDVSEAQSEIEAKLKTSLSVLMPKLDGGDILVVCNKSDRITVEGRDKVKAFLEEEFSTYRAVFVSAVDREGLPALVKAIEDAENRNCMMTARFPLTNSALSLLSELYDLTDLEEERSDQFVRVSFKCCLHEAPKIVARIKAVGGIIEGGDTSFAPTPPMPKREST